MIVKKILAILIGTIFVYSASQAQQEFTLRMMQTIPQSVHNNPALVPQFDSYVGLPGISSIYTSEYNSGFSYNDLFTRREDDSLVLNLESLNNKLKSRNYLINEQEVDLLSFGFRINPRMYLNFNFTARDLAYLEYPDDIMALFVDGNSEYIGQTMDLKLNFDGIGYFETALGLSYKINNRLVVGGRFKYLSGVLNVQTEQAEFSLFTDEFYELTVSGDVDIKTSGIEEMSNDDFEIGLSDINKYFKNNGFAIDIGATYKVTDKITIGASLVDIGSIKWKNNVSRYNLEKDVSEFTWQGLDIQKLIRDENELEDLQDSLGNSFDFTETKGGSYKTMLPIRSYLSGTYQLPRNAEVGLVLFSEKLDNVINAGLGVVANKQFGKHLDLSLSYSFRKNTYNNLGAGFSLRLPPFQLYAVSDNIIGAPLYTNDIKYLNLRFGINLVFDWHKSQVALPNSLSY